MELFNVVINEMANFLKSDFLSVIVLILTAVILAVLIVSLIIQITSKTVINVNGLKYLISMLYAINLTLSSFEFIYNKNTFKTIDSIVAFNVSTLGIILLFAFTISLTISVKEYKQLKNVSETQAVTQNSNNIQLQKGENLSQAATPITLSDGANVVSVQCVSTSDYGNGYDGFLDISYLKSLIALLRQKSLSSTDESELDEFEVYLMNFASRQPRQSERIKLSGYLSNFIKKLARYDAC